MKNCYKILFAIIFCLSMESTNAQSPQAIPYQAVARDNASNLIANQAVSLRISIQNAFAVVLYKETHSTTTNSLGLFTINIGQGTVVTGTFAGIDWTTSTKFLKVELDATGGSSYVDMGTQQMLSVPYAFYSSKAGGNWSLTGNSGLIDGTNFIGTLDFKPLNFVVSGEKSGRIDPFAGNTFLGFRSGKSNNSGLFNTALGYEAFTSDVNGQGNTAIGNSALKLNNGSLNNTAVGYFSLGSNVFGFSNTAVGSFALTLNTSSHNTAVGTESLSANTTGNGNTSIGSTSLSNNKTGSNNTATGMEALKLNKSGNNNTAYGSSALHFDTTGNDNTAIGSGALVNCTGSNNTALGASAGLSLTTGSRNIMIGNQGLAADNNVIRLGTSGFHFTTFIAGINGVNIGSGVNVLINSSGQLGTVLSSQRFKKDIMDMGEVSKDIYKLRPVTFHYKDEYANGDHSLQYGLIAEETAAVNPDLVATDSDGVINTVRYQLLTPLMLNELLKEHAINLEQNETIALLQSQVEKLMEENLILKKKTSSIENEFEKMKAPSVNKEEARK